MYVLLALASTADGGREGGRRSSRSIRQDYSEVSNSANHLVERGTIVMTLFIIVMNKREILYRPANEPGATQGVVAQLPILQTNEL
jgi:hypothetical protein